LVQKSNGMSRLLYQIALSLVPGIGSITAKKIISYTGNIEDVFKQKKATLLKIPGIGEILAHELTSANVMNQAEEELKFIEKYNITTLFYLDASYPARLKHCEDSPILLYVKGKTNLDAQKIISIVGTRNATDYGKSFCEKLIQSLASSRHNPIIVSGLAFGIDITAHRAALKNKLETVAVLAHGLKTVYPAIHTRFAKEISNQGALITEFTSNVKADRALFVRRNRIIAGLSDATIVIESGEKGGALITADIANSYNRDVFAVPGRIDDPMSKGCNKLIKTNKAVLLENVEDLEYLLAWEQEAGKTKTIQRELFVDITEDEKKILEIVQNNREIPIDNICIAAEMPVSKVSPLLLSLEFAGLVRSLPGKVYKIV
jgi:DNA processing protein